MPTSTYFNNINTRYEQNVLEDLVVESIRIFGIDVYLCPRHINDKDEIYGEDPTSSYESSYQIEMYLTNIDGYEGDGVFMSRFGMEIRDQVTFSVAVKTYTQLIGRYNDTTRPKEGDLIWLALNPERPQLFQIKYVNDRALYYQLGTLQLYDLTCEVFEYSGERLSTGIPEIDIIQFEKSTDIGVFALLTSDGKILTDSKGFAIVQSGFDLDQQVGDPYADNQEFQEESIGLILFSEQNPFSEGPY
jgi:hypothetical protein